MNKFSCYTSRTGNVLSQQLQLVWRTAMLLLAAFLFSANAFGQTCPTAPGTIVVDGNPCDWASVYSSSSVTVKSLIKDANDTNDSQFTGGSQDPDLISEWSWVLGNTNDKGDITNSGAALIGCNLYFFGDRTAINGDAQIGFWFFKDEVAPLGSGTTAAGFSGAHQNGDLLILANFTNGGGTATIKVYTWQNGSLVLASPAPGSGAVNSTSYSVPNVTYPPTTGETWSYTAKGGSAGTYPTGSFFEGVVNLCTLYPGGLPCFSSFLMETRNSQSITASLQDFVGGNFDITPAIPLGTATDETCLVDGTITVTNPIVGLSYILKQGTTIIETIIADGDPVIFDELEAGIYSLSAKFGECESGGRPIEVDADLTPVSAPGVPDVDRCGPGTVTLTVEIPLGGVTYRWYDETGNQLLLTGTTTSTPRGDVFTTPSLSQTTTYLVTATSANGCESATTSVQAIIQPPVVVNAGADVTSCEASPVQLNGSITGGATTGEWVGGTGTFDPNRQALNAIYTPSAAEVTAGTVTLTLQSVDPPGACPAEDDMMTITINDEVSVSAGADQTVCSDDPDVTLAGSISGGITTGEWVGGTGTFTPNRQTLNAVYTPSAAEITAGTVTLTLQSDEPDGPCEAASDMMTITINPAATVEAGGPYTVTCAEPRSVQLNGSFGGGATSGTWSGGSGTFSPNANTANAVYTPSAAELAAGTSIILTFTTNDPAGPCEAESDMATVNFDVCRQDIFCTRTQGFYGNEGGRICDGRTTRELLGDLLTTSIVLGRGGNTFTVGAGEVDCVIDILPGGKQAKALDGAYTCATIPLSKQGRLENGLLAQTLVLGLNLRMDPGLSSAPLSASFVTLGTTGCGETAVSIPGTGMTFYISSKVLDELEDNYSLTVGGLYALANDALGGVYVPMNSGDPSLTDIHNAVDTINNAFDGCRALQSTLTASTSSSLQGIEKAEAGELRAYPTPFSDKATIEFTTAVDENYTVRLYDMRGALIKELKSGTAKAGVMNQVEVDGRNLPEGLYLGRVVSDSGSQTVKLLLKR